jgi:class 3 adenylate cyclase
VNVDDRSSGTATVLFTDLVGSTELMSRLGDVSYDELRGEHFTALRKALSVHHGAEIKNTGDGLMATFTSAVEALQCAVAMQQAADQQTTWSTAVAIRIGLSTGEVTFEGGDVFGTAVVEAARLAAAARPGQILATAVVRMLAGSRAPTTLADVGALELKGLPDPVVACEVSWEPAVAAVPLPPLVTGSRTVFVGRDVEIERLEALWKESSAGEHRIALVAGEPGVGKTRLAAELSGSVYAAGAVVLAGRCDEEMGVPYQPFVEALRHLVSRVPEPDLAGRLGRFGGELVRLVPELASVADLPTPLSSDPETERYRLFDAVAAWFSALSSTAPVLLVLDDLQWAAKPTLLLLRHVLRSSEPMRLLVVGTYRNTEVGRGSPLAELLANLRRDGGMERISLSGLDAAAVADFLGQAAGRAVSEEDEVLARVLHAETEGNPFFVSEVLRYLIETGGVLQEDGRWVTTQPIETLGIPEGVRDVVGQRLSRLSESANEALSLAAVVGTEFELAVLEQAGSVSGEDLLSALDEVVAAHLVAEVAGPPGRYRFAHALVRDALYDELSAPRRVRRHARVAEAIQAVHAGALDDHLPALAHHYALAAAPTAPREMAVDFAARAGDRALAQLAHDEAASYYRQALELLDVGEEARRLDLLLALGEAERRAGDARYRQTLLDAATLAKQLGDIDALTHAALTNNRGLFSVVGLVDDERVEVLEDALAAHPDPDSPVRARLLAGLGRELVYGDRHRRVRLSDEALAIARRVGDAPTLAEVLLGRFYAIAAPTTAAERLENMRQLVDLAETLEDPALACRALGFRARVAVELGDIEQADACLDAHDRLSSDLGQPHLRWFANWQRTAQALWRGQTEVAERGAGETHELARACGQPDADLFFVLNTFWIRFEEGRLDDELVALLLDTLARHPGATFLEGWLALLYAETGRLTEARRCLGRLEDPGYARLGFDHLWLAGLCPAAAAAARVGDANGCAVLSELLAPFSECVAACAHMILGSVAHHLGMLATAVGDFDSAEIRFAAAEATHERIGAPAWLARTWIEWARMLRDRAGPGDDDRSRALLGHVLESARTLGLVGVERQAVALLAGNTA